MNLRILFFLLIGVTGFFACSDDGGTTIIPIAMGEVSPNVGGEEQPNQVFIDLSSNTETVIPRRNWDLGFSTDANYRVVLNGSNGMLAAPTATTDFASVTSAELSNFPFSSMNMDALFGILVTPGVKPPWFDQAATWADHPNGKLSNTAIAEVSAVDDNNPVYIINRGKNEDGSARGFMKLHVTRTSSGYVAQFGELDDAVGEILTIEKDPDYNFIFMRMGQGVIQVEPKKREWDICFSTYTDHVLSEFNSGFPVPYVVQDNIYLNRFGTAVATIDDLTTALADYQAFTLENSILIGNQGGYKAEINAIGTGWRTVATPQVPGSVTAPKDDRFYLIADSEGIPFKLIMTRMQSESDERGHPEFIYEELR